MHESRRPTSQASEQEPPSEQVNGATEPTRGRSHRANKRVEPPSLQEDGDDERTRERSHRANNGTEPTSEQGNGAAGPTRGRSSERTRERRHRANPNFRKRTSPIPRPPTKLPHNIVKEEKPIDKSGRNLFARAGFGVHD